MPDLDYAHRRREPATGACSHRCSTPGRWRPSTSVQPAASTSLPRAETGRRVVQASDGGVRRAPGHLGEIAARRAVLTPTRRRRQNRAGDVTDEETTQDDPSSARALRMTRRPDRPHGYSRKRRHPVAAGSSAGPPGGPTETVPASVTVTITDTVPYDVEARLEWCPTIGKLAVRRGLLQPRLPSRRRRLTRRHGRIARTPHHPERRGRPSTRRPLQARWLDKHRDDDPLAVDALIYLNSPSPCKAPSPRPPSASPAGLSPASGPKRVLAAAKPHSSRKPNPAESPERDQSHHGSGGGATMPSGKRTSCSASYRVSGTSATRRTRSCTASAS